MTYMYLYMNIYMILYICTVHTRPAGNGESVLFIHIYMYIYFILNISCFIVNFLFTEPTVYEKFDKVLDLCSALDVEQ